MITTIDISLVEGGQQEEAGAKEFFCEQDEHQHYLLLLCNARTILHIRQKQYYMQPFTFLFHPFDGSSLTVETNGASFYRYLHLQCSDGWIQKLLQSGFTLMETYTLAKPLDVEEIWRILLPFTRPEQVSTELGEYALKLLIYLLMLPSDGTVTRAAEVPHYDKLTSLRYRIYQYPAQSWYIQDICDELGISRPYFHKLYVTAFHTTCTQDVIASRIARARMLLEVTEHPVSAIAQQCGFESDVYFMRQFKRRVGMTPTAYRRVYRQSEAKPESPV